MRPSPYYMGTRMRKMPYMAYHDEGSDSNQGPYTIAYIYLFNSRYYQHVINATDRV